jgi:hypothetical protein
LLLLRGQIMLHSSADFALIAFHIVEHAVEKQKL